MVDTAIIRAKIMLDIDSMGEIARDTMTGVYNSLNDTEIVKLTVEQQFIFVVSEVTNVIRSVGNHDLDNMVNNIVDGALEVTGATFSIDELYYYKKLIKVSIISRDNIFGYTYNDTVKEIIEYIDLNDEKVTVPQKYLMYIKYLNILLSEDKVDMEKLRGTTAKSEALSVEYSKILKESLKYDFHV